MKCYDVYMTNGNIWKHQILYDEYGDKYTRLGDIEISGREGGPAIIAVDQDSGKNKKILNKYAISTIIEIVLED